MSIVGIDDRCYKKLSISSSELILIFIFIVKKIISLKYIYINGSDIINIVNVITHEMYDVPS